MNALDRWAEPFRQKLTKDYNHIVSLFPSPVFAETFFLALISIGIYWSVGYLYYLIDRAKKPNFFYKYKIQRSTNFDYSQQNLSKIFRQVIINQMLQITMFFLYANFKYKHGKIQTELPTPSRLLLEITVFLLLREAGFYYTHRLLHHKSLYKYIHKKHHEYQSPISWTAIYCSPVEHFLSNVGPVMLGPMVMNSHTLVNNCWGAYVILLTLNHHCGYHFPFNFLLISPLHHDFHHYASNVCFGNLGLLDWLHGTDKAFRASKYWKSNRIYFGLNPPKEFYYSADKME